MVSLSCMKSTVLLVPLMLITRLAYADPTTPLGNWFCSTLNNFDVATAFQTFPLQKLGKPEEIREKTKDRISVSVRAESLDLVVEYSYQFNESNVDEKYGFELGVVDKEGIILDERKAMLWLMEFGKPERGMMNWSVATHSENLTPPFSFIMEESPYIKVAASWFYDKDIRRARSVCDAAKAPPEKAQLPNAADQGPAADPKKDPLSVWFCSVLKKDFNFSKAAEKFPLEPLVVEAEHRETDDGRVTVSRLAEGDDYKVEYQYTYREEDVDAPYGFRLSVQHSGIPNSSSYDEGMKWLRGFGTPKKDVLGSFAVTVSQDGQGFPEPFAFSFWSVGIRSAEWFNESDIDLATKLCP